MITGQWRQILFCEHGFFYYYFKYTEYIENSEWSDAKKK